MKTIYSTDLEIFLPEEKLEILTLKLGIKKMPKQVADQQFFRQSYGPSLFYPLTGGLRY